MNRKKESITIAVLVLLVILTLFLFEKPLFFSDKKVLEDKKISLEPTDIQWSDVLAGNANVDDYIKTMTTEEKVGQLLMPDFRKWEGKGVTILNDEIRKTIKDYHLGGIILFRENIDNRSQTKRLIDAMQESSKDIPLLIGVDQEGGIVTRIPFAPKMPGNMALGATHNEEMAKQTGIAIGSELRRLGIQVDFGPVLDINNNPDNPVIGVRSFGDNPEIVEKLGMAYMKGLNDAGVIAVGKHFPGHGDVEVDSHFVLPSSNKSLEQIRDLELKPFQALINEGIQGIMTAHITFNNISTKSVESMKDGLPIKLPATLSSEIVTDILRKEMNYDGLVFSDAMDMKAIADHFGTKDAAVGALQAGVDIILMPEKIDQAYEGILEAVQKGELSEGRIDQSVKRILSVKASKIINDNTFTEMSVQDAIKLENNIAQDSITVVTNDGLLPLKENSTKKIALVAESSTRLKHLENAIKPYEWKINSILINKGPNWNGSLTPEQRKQLKACSTVIIATNTANQEDRNPEGWQMKTVQSVLDLKIPSIVIATRNPYDIQSLKGMDVYIAQYDDGIPSFNATAEVIFGKKKATGQLPVSLGN